MARKSKLAPVVVESTVQDELSAAMSAMVSAPVADGDVLVQAETVVLTESTVEIPAPVEITDALGEFGPQILADAPVEITSEREIHGSYKKVMRPIWNTRPGPGMIRRELEDGSMEVVKSAGKYLNHIWFGLADKSNRDDPCPFYVAVRADGFWDLMIES